MVAFLCGGRMKPTMGLTRSLRLIGHAIGIGEHPDKLPAGRKRSPKWRTVRRQWLKEHSQCEACGGRDGVEVHHCIPFHVDPGRELDRSNLITLCEKGPGSTNCHCLIGHCGDWKAFNPAVEGDANHMRAMLLRKMTG